jgi:hypothetical protein
MMPWYLGNSGPFGNSMMGSWGIGTWIVPLAVWSALWTGLALWHAARREEKWWFIFFLFVHTAGIVEILYLIFVARAFGQKSTPRRRSR